MRSMKMLKSFVAQIDKVMHSGPVVVHGDVDAIVETLRKVKADEKLRISQYGKAAYERRFDADISYAQDADRKRQEQIKTDTFRSYVGIGLPTVYTGIGPLV